MFRAVAENPEIVTAGGGLLVVVVGLVALIFRHPS